MCTCRVGYTGPDCSVCSTPEREEYTYICVSKQGENLNDRKIDEEASRSMGTPVLKPIRFMLIAINKREVEDVLTGNHPLTRGENKFALLTGTAINGTVYGCNCLPADPVESDITMPVKMRESPSEAPLNLQDVGTDAIAIREHMLKNPMSEKEKQNIENTDTMITRHRKFVTTRALTLMQAEGFLQEVFDFFEVDIDVATGTPETVGAGVEDVKNVATYDRVSCILYFIISTTIIILFMVIAIIAVLYFTGGRIQ